MKENLIKHTVDLVKIPSVIGNEKEIADYVEAFLKRHLKNIIRHNNSLIAFNDFEPSKKNITLLGHLDTVPGSNDYTGQVIDGKIYGLGASDMKGGLAVMMTLIEYFSNKESKYNLVYVFYEKEEGPYQENGLEPLLQNYDIIQKSDIAFALEPTNNRIQMGCLGTMHGWVKFKGKRAHSARPWEGENAIHKAYKLLEKLYNFDRKEYDFEGLKFYEVMNATMVEYSGGRNIIPEEFRININYRFAPGKTIEQAKQEFIDFVGNQAEVEFTDISPAGKVCKDNPILKEMINQFNLQVEAKQAWTDVGRLSLYGVDAVNFGPGDTAQAHQKNEYIPVENLIKNFEIYSKFFSVT
ncbi:MAG: succinyl-diaminopimelate desuccinylase [Sulfurihydrogenibium sp.]|jgi:succinyl-diaminopimelate desuccinylase|uniref:succinyl-diaminopimelate desuccinylase n=1 Tax=Sulfurihydrogenibium sp. TaxID=2053621 RepID=UPI003D0F2868